MTLNKQLGQDISFYCCFIIDDQFKIVTSVVLMKQVYERIREGLGIGSIT